MKRIAIVLALTVMGATPALADKPLVEHKVSHGRILLGDVVDGAPEALASIDLGPSPQPGSSRVVRREDVERAVIQGLPPKLKVPVAVRIVRATKTLSPTDLEATTRTAIAAITLARGATYGGARPGAAVTVPAGYDLVRAEIPRPPRRAGKLATIATLTFLEGDTELARIQVPIDIELPKDAAFADVPKGAKVTFVITRGSVEIRASGTAGGDADVGEDLTVTVMDSGRVLRGKLKSRDPAVVTEAP